MTYQQELNVGKDVNQLMINLNTQHREESFKNECRNKLKSTSFGNEIQNLEFVWDFNKTLKQTPCGDLISTRVQLYWLEFSIQLSTKNKTRHSRFNWKIMETNINILFTLKNNAEHI